MNRLTFKRGRRGRKGWGMYYPSTCGRVSLYRSQSVSGVMLPLRWLVFHHLAGYPHLVSRHRTRRAAERAATQYVPAAKPRFNAELLPSLNGNH